MTSTNNKYVEYFDIKTISPNKAKIQTNTRYRNFCQINFTAGDEEQFFNLINKENVLRKKKTKLSSIKVPTEFIKKYKKINTNSIIDTFRYIFHELKKGIFIQIKNNKVVTFLPFSKYNYVNDWANNIDVDKRFSNLEDLLKYCQTKSNKEYNPRKILKVNEWVGNNFLVRFEYPQNEGDSNVTNIKHMFETLCRYKKVPNIDFFINRRDFPILRDDSNYPYVLSKKKCKLQNPCPVLSMSSNPDYMDIPIPTWDDWAKVCYRDDKIFFSSNYIYRKNKEYPKIKKTNWENKIPKAIFRGSSTGQGVTIDTNPRLKLASIKHHYIDAGITQWNLRPRIIEESDDKYILSTICIDDLSFSTVETVSPQEQSKYKYIINVDGHSAAFRISLELEMNSIILMVKSNYVLWNTWNLEEDVHYISIKRDLSDLIEKIEWCENNPEKCKKILENLTSYKKKLSKGNILNYLQKTLWNLSDNIGNISHNVIDVIDVIIIKEKKILNKEADVKIPNINSEVLVKTKSTVIEKYGNLVLKSVIKEKQNELIHEAFIYQKGLKSLKSSQFSKNLGFCGDKTVWEYIKGITLAQYIQKQFNFKEFKNIIIQICGILQSAHELCEFTHNDLYCWNIILVNEPISTTYKTKRGSFSVNSHKKVVIIDFGKSHIIYKHLHYGRIRPYESSSIRDIICFIISSVNLILNNHLPQDELHFIFTLMNFFSYKR